MGGAEPDARRLNVFFSRLLFCFFAEDTNVFEEDSFTNAIASLTQADGSDTGHFLDQLFKVLGTHPANRLGTPAHFQGFGYVGGRLFTEHVPAPNFSSKARRIIIEGGALDWSEINPDIFGSIIQAIAQPRQREGLGMHYTSVENIMKVIRPLFLDDLHHRFDQATTVPQLNRLLAHISEIKVFDPACGSGNFLVIAYKKLRKLEHRILQRTRDLEPILADLFKISEIKLDHFFGIEIDDFAHEIAVLSLWLAKHQMNVEFHALFSVEIPLIPLEDTGSVNCGNAARVDWNKTCSRTEGRVFVLGNPPYRGGNLQSAEQKADFVEYFGTTEYPRKLDYISIWFLKGAEYIAQGNAELGFVSTNSVVQGDHVSLLWPRVLNFGIQIAFAHDNFAWSNSAKGSAGVMCVVIGLSVSPPPFRPYYVDDQTRLVENINPYLRPVPSNTIVHASPSPLNGLPPMDVGSQANDGGHLTLTPFERDSLIDKTPEAKRFIRKYVGSKEFIRGIDRYCLWIEDDEVDEATKFASIATRLEAVRLLRSRGGHSARTVAAVPHRFGHRAHRPAPAIIVPRVSSERRTYVPMGFIDQNTVVSDAAFVVYGAEPWTFGLLQSQMHMAWVDTVGGRLKNDYRYSTKLIYNTFPVPELTITDKTSLNAHALDLLAIREEYSDWSLAELYNPDTMPSQLQRSHKALDAEVDALYQKNPFHSDDQRVQILLDMYARLVSPAEAS